MTQRLRHILFCLFAAAAVLAQAASVKISVQSRGGSIGVGDTFAIIIEVHDVSDVPSPVASMPGCKVLYPLQPRSQIIQSINGHTTVSGSYAVTLRALSPGNYTFGPIRVGRTTSNKVSYRISAGGARPGQPSSPQSQQGAPKLHSGGDGKLFLRATVSNANPYEQEGVEYVVRLYTSYTSIFDWTAGASPKFGNCTYDASDAVDRQLTLANYGGRAYESAVIARYIIYPTQPGIAKILGNLYTGSVAERYTYTDPYFGTMSRVQPRQIEGKPNDIELNVKPLPAHEGEVCGVGDFRVTAQLVSKQIKSNQPATVRYVVSGTGNLGFVSLPDLAEVYPEELKFLKSDDSMQKKVGVSSVSGTVTFDVTFLPRKEGDFEIPEVKFLFFNPQEGSFYTQTAKGFKINVGKGQASSNTEIVVFDPKMLPAGKVSKAHSFILSRPSIWLWFVLPVLLLAVLMIIYRKRLAMLSDVTGMKMRKAGKMARKRLKKAYDCMRKHNREGFYGEMLKALWGYLGDKLSMPVSELSRDNVSDALQAKGVSQKTIDEAVNLIDLCEFAKYGSNADADMKSDYEQGCRLIDNIESEISSAKSAPAAAPADTNSPTSNS